MLKGDGIIGDGGPQPQVQWRQGALTWTTPLPQSVELFVAHEVGGRTAESVPRSKSACYPRCTRS